MPPKNNIFEKHTNTCLIFFFCIVLKMNQESFSIFFDNFQGEKKNGKNTSEKKRTKKEKPRKIPEKIYQTKLLRRFDKIFKNAKRRLKNAVLSLC